MKKVELLSPAGSYESFLGAIHAGADAVYLGGRKFGARAYADNFSQEEVCKAISYAHVYGKKVYLTLNTLVKEREFFEIYDYLSPFYLAGLDGVIIQDIGVFRAIGRWFPDLARHVSTQMTVTGALGAAYMKQIGAGRIVPARELSLEEIKDIKQKTDIEIEAFIHGAMCYCYSGQCLFSSIVGGRSGNRGRCAQPCRLPYETEFDNNQNNSAKEQYPLSLKDMCTIEFLPELIEAGIDSFKIEGRMKSPEYTAGVTALYRKYIDMYYEDVTADYRVTKEDMSRLKSLYIRSEISEGYYHRHNAREMVTIDNPAYAGRDEQLAEELRDTYLNGDYRLSAKGAVRLHKNEPAMYTVSCKTYNNYNIEVSVTGAVVEEAIKQPLTEDNVIKQLLKSGNTVFDFQQIETDMDSDIFLPVKALNDLRRFACEALEKEIILEKVSERTLNQPKTQSVKSEEISKALPYDKERKLHASVRTWEQLRAIENSGVQRIYISSDMLEYKEEAADKKDKNFFTSKEWEDLKKNTEIYVALPYIIRKRDSNFLKQMETLLKRFDFSGVLVRNYEELQWLLDISYEKDIVTDTHLYLWNEEAYAFYEDDEPEKRRAGSHYLPYEYNLHEIEDLTKRAGKMGLAQVVYGRIPMMISANCIGKTMGHCLKQEGHFLKQKKETTQDISWLTDRMHKKFPVNFNCRHCYNVIYNSLPLSLHQSLRNLEKAGISVFRLDFTIETAEETKRIVEFFEKKNSEKCLKEGIEPPYKEYTNGHLKRGVE